MQAIRSLSSAAQWLYHVSAATRDLLVRYDCDCKQTTCHASQPMTLLNLCTDVSTMSPCLMTLAYRAFLASGRFVSTMPLTRSIEQLRRPAAMKRDRSL